MKKLFLTFCLASAFAPAALADSYLGYCTDEVDRSSGVRVGNSETQGLAIKLTGEKLEMLRGKQIKGVRAAFGTRNMDNLTFYVWTDIAAEPVYTQAGGSGSVTMREFDFDEPYTVGAEQELYVGYTLTSSTAYTPLMFDQTRGLAGCTYYIDGESRWRDAFSLGHGVPSLQLIVDDMQFTDVTVKDFDVNGYYIAGRPYTYSAQVFNYGTEPISSFDVEFSIGNAEPQTMTVSGVGIASHDVYTFDLPEYVSDSNGDLPIKLAVTNINGGTDAAESDNSVDNTIYIYPSDIRRAVLFEGFTGQECGNCPSGRVSELEAFSRFDGDFVEVYHHIGYYPDSLTMLEEQFYMNFYGESNYAPAFMVNRLPGSSSPNAAQSVSVGNVLNMLEYANSIQPYFDIDIVTKYDEATRRVTGDVRVFPHVMPDADTLMVSLFVVQDSILMYQSGGGTLYSHPFVYRGSLFGDIGVRANLTRGVTELFSVDYELPEYITSTYFDAAGLDGVDIPTDPDNMYLVALVSKYKINDDGSLDCPVYNVCQVKLCDDNTTAIRDVVADGAPAISVSGNVVRVAGQCGGVGVYDLSGRMVKSMQGAGEFTLPSGLYVVRAADASGTVSRKVAVQ